jgi:hypothetical protein
MDEGIKKPLLCRSGMLNIKPRHEALGSLPFYHPTLFIFDRICGIPAGLTGKFS